MPNPWLQETQGICTSGVNSAVRPDLIGQDQIVWGTNMTTRDGKPRTRSGLVQRMLLPAGKVQGAGYFSQRGGMLILSIGGYLYRVTATGNNFTLLPIDMDFPNSAALPSAWMVETVSAFLVQDGQSNCIIYDGATFRRADASLKEVPLGRQMAYGNGRLWVAVGNQDLLAGDIQDTPGSELFFTETTYLQGGGALFYPTPITALAFLPTNNTSSGYGSLIVFGSNFTDIVRAEITQRDYWSQIPGFQLSALDGIGAASHFAVTKVNQDLWWRDANGEIRSLRSASSDQQSPGNASQSREVSRLVDFETDGWLSQTCGMYFDNRIYFTASPFLHKSGCIAFDNLIALDAAPLATMRGKAPPAYDGQYEGVNFVRLVKGALGGRQRGFAISTDDDGYNRLWEIMPGVREDNYQVAYGDPTPSPIECEAEFRRFNFGDPTKLKRIVRADFYPAEIEGDCSVSLYWRVGNRSQWQFCDTVNFCSQMSDPATADPHVFKNLEPQERGKIKSFTFPEEKDSVTDFLQTVGYDFQIRLVWTGNLLIDRLDIWAKPLSDPPFSNIPELSESCVMNPVVDNQIDYKILPSA